MDPIEKFLLGSVALMMLLYLSALPFVDYYNHFKNLDDGVNERKWQHAHALTLQLTTSFGSAIIFLIFFLLYRINKWKPHLKKHL